MAQSQHIGLFLDPLHTLPFGIWQAIYFDLKVYVLPCSGPRKKICLAPAFVLHTNRFIHFFWRKNRPSGIHPAGQVRSRKRYPKIWSFRRSPFLTFSPSLWRLYPFQVSVSSKFEVRKLPSLGCPRKLGSIGVNGRFHPKINSCFWFPWWDRWYIITQLAVNIPLIYHLHIAFYCLLGDYMLPSTY